MYVILVLLNCKIKNAPCTVKKLLRHQFYALSAQLSTLFNSAKQLMKIRATVFQQLTEHLLHSGLPAWWRTTRSTCSSPWSATSSAATTTSTPTYNRLQHCSANRLIQRSQHTQLEPQSHTPSVLW